MGNVGTKPGVSSVINAQGIIEQRYRGDQTSSSVKSGINQIDPLAEKCLKDKRPVLILIDITELGKTTAGARKTGLDGLKRVPYRKVAIYGSLVNQILVNLLATVSGREKSVGAFSKREEAIAWLRTGVAAKSLDSQRSLRPT